MNHEEKVDAISTEWHVGAHQGYDAVGLVTRGLRLLER